MKDFIRDYFTFTKKERTAVVILLVILLLGIFIPFLFTFFNTPESNNVKALEQIIDSTSNSSEVQRKFPTKRYYPSKGSTNKSAILFDFDPNTATEEDWIRLGVREKTAKTICKYVAKGGHFYKPEDLSKIYGLHENDLERLLPYVKIAASKPLKNFSYVKSDKDENIVIDINSADSLTLMKLPGIGKGFSRKIINFRNKLGGFYSVDQIGETYGLPDSTFQKLKNNFVIHSSVKKININSATLEDLRTHPYIKYQIANSIVQYRLQHGVYKDIADLKKIMIISDPLFDKISHYISID